ncbi:MAG: response regulator [Lacipirellulaceae bacterium]
MTDSPRSALIVDDEPQVRDLMSRALLRCGICCDQASNGAEGLDLLRGRAYDAVVTDLRMPVKHGHSFCVDMLALPAPPPVLVLTALADPRLVRDLIGRGVRDVVCKPVDYSILAEKVLAMASAGKTNSAAVRVSRAPALAKLNLLQKIEQSLVELSDIYADRMDAAFDFDEELAEPPAAVRAFVRRLAEAEAMGGGKHAVVLPGDAERRHDRVTCFTTATAVPVDKKWRRNCEPFNLGMRDLSEGGVRLLHTRATRAEFLALSWKPTHVAVNRIRVVIQVKRCTPQSPFYDVGGQFVFAD